MKNKQDVFLLIFSGLFIAVILIVNIALLWNRSEGSSINSAQTISDANAERRNKKPKPSDVNNIFSKNIAVKAAFYQDIKEFLRPGDSVSMPAVRNSPDTPMTVGDNKFQTALTKLAEVTQSNLKKGIVFSAVDDVRNLIGVLPSDITIIGYDFEGGMTPLSEMQNPVGSVTQFAEIVHAAGKEVAFGPTVAVWNGLERNGKVPLVARAVDIVILQGQNILSNGGMTALIEQVSTLGATARNANPNVSFSVQLWVGNNPPADMIAGFINIEDLIDTAIIGTQNDLPGVQEVLLGLGR